MSDRLLKKIFALIFTPSRQNNSPVEYGSLSIYDHDATFLYSIDLDYQYTPSGTYYIDLALGTKIFKLQSEYTNYTAYITMYINQRTINIDLNICDGSNQQLPRAYGSCLCINDNHNSLYCHFLIPNPIHHSIT